MFLAERYLPGATTDRVEATAAALREAVATLADLGTAVRLLSTTYVPSEDWVFELFQADRAAEVEQTYAAAHVAVDRIAEAVQVGSDPMARTSQMEGMGR